MKLNVHARSLFGLLPLLMVPVLFGPSANAANFIRADTTNVLNQGGAWVGGALPGTGDTAIWDSTVATPLNCSNTQSGTLTVAGVIISNPPVTVTIANDTAASRILSLRTNGITVTNSRDLIIDLTLNAAMDQTWNIGPGRLLTFGNLRPTTNFANVNLIGNLRMNRTFDISSNSTFTLTPSSFIDSETNGAALLRVGANSLGGKLVQTGGTMLLGRSNGASIFVIGQTLNSVASYTFTGGTNNTRLNDLGTTVIAGNTNVVATMTMASNAQFLANGMSLATFQTSSASLFMSGNAFISANGAVVAATARSASNTITMGGNSLFQANSNFTLGSGPFSVSTFSLSNNAQFGATAAVLVASSTNAIVTINARDSAQFLMTSNFTVASNAAATLARVTITASNSSLLTVGGLAIFGSATNSTCIVGLSDTAQFLISGNLTFGAGLGSTSAVALSGSAVMGAGGNVVFVNNLGAKGTLTISNNAQFLGGGALTLAGTSVNAFTNAVATVRVADNGVLNIGGPASTSIIGSRGLATLTITNNGSATFSNLLQLSSSTGTNDITGIGIVNLDGGILSAGQITRGTILTNLGVTNANLRLNGGILRALTNSADFMPIQATTNPTPVNIMAGGAFFDTQNLIVSNSMPFLHGTGVNPDGGFVKLGSGTLYMLGTNTWSGLTVVSNGTLALSLVHAGQGAVQVRDGAAFEVRVNTNNTSLVLSGLTAGSSTGATLNFDTMTNGSPTTPMIIATNLILNGTVDVNVRTAGNGLSTGTIVLIDYEGTIGGGGSFNLASLPPAVFATLVTNVVDTRIELNISAVPLQVKWNGLDNSTNNPSWQIGGPLNWIDNLTLNPAIYAEGYFVSFDDSAAGTTDITMNFNTTPGGVVLPFNNSTTNYSISGSGSINGPLDLTKDGTGILTMGLTNDYLGSTYINAGTFKVGTNEAIPHGPGRGDLIVNGKLDLNGFTETVNGFNGAGVVDNTAATPALFAFATNGVAGTNVVDLGGGLASNYHVFTGSISNSGGGPLTVAKVGAGNTMFGGTSTYTGTNIITAGILAISNGNALGNPANPLVIGSTLFVPSGVSYTNTAQITTIGGTTFIVQTNASVFLSGNIVNTNVVGYSVTVASNGSFAVNNATGYLSNLLINSSSAAFTNVLYTNSSTFRMGRGFLGFANVTLDNTTMLQTNSGGRVDIGEQTNSVVVLHITNNSQLLTRDFFLAKSNLSISTVYQSSGVVSNFITTNTGAAADWRIGGNGAGSSNAVATYNLSGGRFDVLTNFQIGYSSTGIVNITGGSMNSWGGTPVVGRLTNSTGIGYGSLTVSGGSFNALVTNGNFIIGEEAEGVLTITNTGLVTTAGPLMIARSNTAIGTVNLGGGNLQVARVFGSNGLSTFRFLGGTLGAITSTNNFMSGLSTASVASAGAFIDTSNFTVTVNQQLIADPASAGGGLTKLGSGNLILNGTNNSYTGSTAVSAGRLFITPSYSGSSVINVADNAGFGVQRDATTNSGRVGVVNMGTGGATTLILDLGTFANPVTPVARVTSFSSPGNFTVNVTNGVLAPGTITLVDYDAISASGTLVQGSLPPGVTGTIVTNEANSSIDLNITSVVPLSWSGAVDNLWDTNTLNWQANAVAANFQNLISRALFDDTALGNTNVSLLTNWSPSSLVVSNNTLAYSFSGPGRIAGTAGLTKLGTNSLTLFISNNYSGQTIVSDGSLKLGTNNVLRYSAGSSNLALNNNGTLDLNGFSQTVPGLDGNGFIDNTGATRSLLTLGTNVATGSFGGTIQDTVGDILVIKLTTNDYALTGNNTWSGGLFVSAGRLLMTADSPAGGPGPFGSGPLTLNINSTLATTNGARVLASEIRGTNTGTCNIDTTFGNLTLSGVVFWEGPELGKTGTGNLRFSSSASIYFGSTSGLDVNGGSLTYDGATSYHTNDGIRLRANTNFTTVTMIVTNGANVLIGSNAAVSIGATANTGFTNAFTNILYLDGGQLTLDNGTIAVGSTNANVGIVNHNAGTLGITNLGNTGGLILAGNSNCTGIYNLNGGTLLTSRIRKLGGTNNATAVFVFNGGTLKSLNTNNQATFMTGLDQAIITTNHAWIDSSSNSITIGQPLIPATNGTGGSLIKLGSGSLTLTATNTYTNLTDVREGKFFITPTYVSPSVILVSNTAGFGARAISPTNGPAITGTVTLAGLTNTLDFDLGTFGNPTGAVALVTNFTAAGSQVTVNVTGANLSVGSFTLLSYAGTHGNPTLTLGPLPPGVVANLVDNTGNSSIDLNITSVIPLVWDGTNSSVWDIGLSTNWLFLGSPAVFGDGSPVLFDDTANGTTDVTLFSDVTPGGMTVSNVTKNYSFGPTNRILGSGRLTKLGAAVLNLGISNTYTGGTFIEAGTVRLQTNNAIPNGTGTGLFTVNGTFDLNGFVETVNGLSGGGVVDNTSLSNGSLTIGSANSNGVFSGIIQNTGAGTLRLIKAGTGTNVLSGPSTYSGGTSNGAGGLAMGDNSAFGSGPVIFNQSATLLTFGGARTLANAFSTTTNTGTLSIDTTAGDLLITGPVTWTAPDLAKRGPNTLTFGPSVVMNMDATAEVGVRGGSIVLDGSTVVTGDGFRLFAASNTTQVVTATVQNNASVTLFSNANFIVGRQDDTTAIGPIYTNIFTLTSGSVTVSNGGMFIANNIGNTGIMNQNGGNVGFFPVLTNVGSLDMAAATNTLAIYNLNAGTLTVGRIRKTGAGTNAIAQFNFGGGTLVALNNSNSATFMQGLDQVLVRAAGAFIDTSTNPITINQPLLEDPSSTGGGLTKLGTGSLTLTATNTYTNVTAVTAGKLFVGSTYVCPSVINVADGAGFGARRLAANATATVGTVNLGAGGATTLDFDLGTFGDSTTAAAQVTNFTANGIVTVNVSGLNLGLGTITLLTCNGSNGTRTVVTGTLPPGVSGSVVDNGSAIVLTVTGIDYLTWDGTQNSRWDLLSTNWLFLAAPSVYTNGSAVLFKDSPAGGAGSVVLTNDVTPGSILVSNTATTTYTFSGTNRIQGATRLTKLGTGTLVMAATNNETGQITIGDGVLKLGTNDVFRHATGTSNIVVTNTGVFDLNGFLEVLTGIEGNGTIDNTSVSNALLAVGTNAGTSIFTGTIKDTGGDLLLKKSGTGSFTLTGSNNWNGGTFVQAGTIVMGNDYAFGVGPVTVDNASVLAVSGGARVLTNTLLSTSIGGDADINTDGGNLTITGPVNWLVPDLNKQGSNTLIFASSSVANFGTTAELAVRGGSLLVDGATITITNDGFRLFASTNTNSAIVVNATVQNNGTLALLGVANFVLGAAAETNLSTVGLTNNFTLSSGQVTVSNGGYFVGNQVGHAGIFTQLGGTVGFSTPTNTNGVAITGATNTSGIYNLNGGTLTTARLRKIGTNDAFASFRFNGGTLKALNAAFSNDFIQTLNEVLVRAGGATVDSDTFDITINQALLTDAGSPGGGLVKVGAGRLALNGANTYTGTTVVSNGTLGGTGSYAGSVSVAAAGTIAPGNSIGTITLASNLTLAGAAIMEINRTNAQTADLLAAGGAVTYGGTLTVTNLGPDLQSGDTFNLFDGASFTGTFSATNLPALTNGMTWDTSQLTVNGTITVVTPPPPATNPPVIYTVVYGSTTVQLVGTGGPANAPYRVMSETNMTIPYTNWVPVITNNFDPSGNFDTTFPVTPADIRRFYIIIFP